MPGIEGPLANRIEYLHGGNQFSCRKGFDIETSAGGKSNGVREMNSHIIEQQPF